MTNLVKLKFDVRMIKKKLPVLSKDIYAYQWQLKKKSHNILKKSY